LSKKDSNEEIEILEAREAIISTEEAEELAIQERIHEQEVEMNILNSSGTAEAITQTTAQGIKDPNHVYAKYVRVHVSWHHPNLQILHSSKYIWLRPLNLHFINIFYILILAILSKIPFIIY